MTPEEKIARTVLAINDGCTCDACLKAATAIIAQARAEALREAAEAILRYPFAWPRHMPEELAAYIKSLPRAQSL